MAHILVPQVGLKGDMMRYEIDQATFAVSIFNDGEDIPFQYQPQYPNGDAFDSYEEAETWAQAAVASHDPNVNFYAPDGKNIEPKQKVNYEARNELIARLDLSPEELNLLLMQ